jgi:hypothetical protein
MDGEPVVTMGPGAELLERVMLRQQLEDECGDGRLVCQKTGQRIGKRGPAGELPVKELGLPAKCTTAALSQRLGLLEKEASLLRDHDTIVPVPVRKGLYCHAACEEIFFGKKTEIQQERNHVIDVLRARPAGA